MDDFPELKPIDTTELSKSVREVVQMVAENRSERVIEVNGPANIVSFIRLYRIQHWEIPEHVESLLKRIETEAFDTIAYLQRLENPKKVMWYEIKAEKEKENAAK